MTHNRTGRIYSRSAALALLALMTMFAADARAVTIPSVVVGNTGNGNDPLTGNLYGGVEYAYRIGTTEVTNAQYVDFLNAKAKSDPLALYNTFMGSEAHGGITRSGVSGGFTYVTKANMANKPVNFVSWYDSIRFANWLNNGQGTGDTETGAYTILGGTATPINGDSITRNVGAKWFLTGQSEWYKAAYYQPAAQGGDGDDYWLYPTASNSQPMIATAIDLAGPTRGDVGNPGGNVANYQSDADWNGQNGNVTTVASAGPLSESFYGTADQGGNVFEWNEALIGGSFRGMRGGTFRDNANALQSFHRSTFPPTSETNDTGYLIGFRVASIPGPQFPGDVNFDSVVDFTDLGILLNHFNQPSKFATGDFNSSGTVDFTDLGLLLNNYNQHAPVLTTAAPVPEPSTLVLACCGVLSLILAARRTCWSAQLGRWLRRGAFIAVLTLLTHMTSAATSSWTGASGIDNSWSNVANWLGGVPAANADLVFPSGKPTSSNNNISSLQINSLTISASNYALTGNPLTLGSALLGGGKIVVNANAVNNSAAFNIALAGPAGSQQFFAVNSEGTLSLSGQLSGATGSELVKSGTGMLILTADNSGFTGPFSIQSNGGIVRIQHASALGAASQTFTVGQNSQLQLNNIPDTIAKNLMLNGAGGNNDGALLSLGGTHTLSGNIILDGDVTIGVATDVMTLSGPVFDLGAGHRLSKVGGGTLRLSDSNTFRNGVNLIAGTLSVGHNSALGTGPFNLAGGVTIEADGAARVLSNALTIGGDFSVGGSFDLTLTSPFTLTANRTITVTGAGIATLSGDIGSSGLSGITKSGAGTLQLSGDNRFRALTVTGGTLIAGSNSALGIGTLTIDGGAVDLGYYSLGEALLNFTAGSLSWNGNLIAGTGGLLGTDPIIAANQTVHPSGTTMIDPGHILTIDGGILTTAILDNSQGGGINFVSGTVQITGSGGLDLGQLAAAVSLASNQSLNVTNELRIADGAVMALNGGGLSAGSLRLAGGTVLGAAGLNMPTAIGDNRIAGHGNLNVVLTSNSNSQIVPDGVLMIGDLSSASGFAFAGTLNIGANQVYLQDADRAQLGRLTMLAEAGRLSAVNGSDLTIGCVLTATGNAQIGGNFTNNGTVNGASTAGRFLSFNNNVNGAGTYTGNIQFLQGFSPGNGPAVVRFERGEVVLGTKAKTSIELGGTTKGAYDQLLVSGRLTLGGGLDLSLVTGFQPRTGDFFANIYSAASVAGAFNSVTGTHLDGGLLFNTITSATSLGLLAALPGDANLDRAADFTDLGILLNNYNVTGFSGVAQWNAGDFNDDHTVDFSDLGILLNNYNQHAPALATAVPVPEPSTLVLVASGLIGISMARRRRLKK